MYYASNERNISSLSTGIFIPEDKHESKNIYTKMFFFYLNFSIVHISTNHAIGSLKLCLYVGNIHVEGTVSPLDKAIPRPFGLGLL